MSFLKEIFKSMARTLGRILVYFLLALLAYFIFKNNAFARTGGTAYIINQSGVTKNSYTFTYNDYPFSKQIENFPPSSNSDTFKTELRFNDAGNINHVYTFSMDYKIEFVTYGTSTTANINLNQIRVYWLYDNGSTEYWTGCQTVGTQSDGTYNGIPNSNKRTYQLQTYCSDWQKPQRSDWGSPNKIKVEIPLVTTNTPILGYRYTINEEYKATADSTTDLKDLKSAVDTMRDSLVNSNNQNTNRIISTLEELNELERQSRQEEIDSVNDNIDDLHDYLSDTSQGSYSGVSNFPGSLPPGPVDSLLLLPLQFLNMLITAFSVNSCPEINLTIPIIGGTFRLKCLNEIWGSINGFNTFINILIIPLIGFYIYKALMSLYNYIHDLLMLNNGSLNSKWKEWGGI